MRRTELELAGLLLLTLCGVLRGEDARPAVTTAAPLKAAGLVALVEGLAALNAVGASEVPGIYGGLLTLTAPLAASERLNNAGDIAAIAGVLALGQYNFNYVSNRPDAQRRRFWVTFAGLHAASLIAVGVDRLTGGPGQRRAAKGASVSAWRLSPLVADGGGGLLVSRRF